MLSQVQSKERILDLGARSERAKSGTRDGDNSRDDDRFVFQMTLIASQPSEVICVDSSDVVGDSAHLCLVVVAWPGLRPQLASLSLTAHISYTFSFPVYFSCLFWMHIHFFVPGRKRCHSLVACMNLAFRRKYNFGRLCCCPSTSPAAYFPVPLSHSRMDMNAST